MSDLRQRILDIQMKSGKTREEFANELGISVKTFYNYMNGRTTIHPKAIYKVAELYNVSVDYLLHGDGLDATNQAGPALSDTTVIDYNSGTSAQAHAGMNRNFGVESLCLDEYPTEEALVGELDEQIKTLLSVIRTQCETIRRLSAILAAQTQKPNK